MKLKHIILLISLILLILLLKPKTQFEQPISTRFYGIYLPLINPKNSQACWALHSRQLMQPDDIDILRPSCFLTWKIAPNNRGLPIDHINVFWCDNVESWEQLHNYIPTNSTEVLLFLNEPDLPTQCNITPQQAFTAYEQILLEYPAICLSAPEVSHMDYLNDWQWLRAFYTLVLDSSLKMPCFGTIHTYLPESPENIVVSYLNLVRSYPGASLHIWVTEFGQNNYEQVYAMVDYYQNNVDRYFYYAPRGVSFSLFVAATYNLTPMGQAWVELVP